MSCRPCFLGFSGCASKEALCFSVQLVLLIDIWFFIRDLKILIIHTFVSYLLWQFQCWFLSSHSTALWYLELTIDWESWSRCMCSFDVRWFFEYEYSIEYIKLNYLNMSCRVSHPEYEYEYSIEYIKLNYLYMSCRVSHPEYVLANATWLPSFQNEAELGPLVIHLYEVGFVRQWTLQLRKTSQKPSIAWTSLEWLIEYANFVVCYVNCVSLAGEFIL